VKGQFLRCVFIYTGLLLLAFAVIAMFGAPVKAAELPQASVKYRLQLERETARHFGLNAPVARLAAQIHQESGWRPKAQSPYAQGLSQFTPATAKWLPDVCPEVGRPDPWDPAWSLRAIACYDAWLYHRVRPIAWGDMRRSADHPASPGAAAFAQRALSECARWHFTLRAYNGGESWINRERRAAAKAGWNPNRWDEVQRVRLRATWAHRENTSYPRRILHLVEPRYRAAGWPATAPC
jgi:hypothetical protein